MHIYHFFVDQLYFEAHENLYSNCTIKTLVWWRNVEQSECDPLESCVLFLHGIHPSYVGYIRAVFSSGKSHCLDRLFNSHNGV